MRKFEHTSLWKSAFSQTKAKDADREKREELRHAFLSFRRRAEQLANEIHRDLPNFTVHDITHIDALWETASLIAGAGLHMTPTEGFVFGGALLVHDLAMTLASYPTGIAELMARSEWGDTVSSLLQKKFGRIPSCDELKCPGPETEAVAMRILLRLFHAEQAEKLPTIGWTVERTTFYLIDNPEIR
jgi:hypothetical protein